MWISIEGIDGAGKSTLMQTIEDFLQQHQKPFIRTFEPGGGSKFCQHVRQVILKPQQLFGDDFSGLDAKTELLLMLAVRREHWLNTIVPALQEQKFVICDRFFDSSFAYQGFGRGLNLEMIDHLSDWIHGFNAYENGNNNYNTYTKPHLTFLLDLPVQVSEQRRIQREEHKSSTKDTFEKEELTFHEKVRQGFLYRATQEPQRIKILDATLSIEALKNEVIFILNAAMKKFEKLELK